MPFQSVLPSPLSLAVLSAPIGATVCGAIAVSQIRRSGGRLYGLGLALAAALVFPLLALDGLIVAALLAVFRQLTFSGIPEEKGVAVAVTIPICALVDLLIARWAWRRVSAPRQTTEVPQANQPRADSRPAPAPKLHARPTGIAAVVHWAARLFGSLLLVMFGLFIVAEGFPAAATQPGAVQVELLATMLWLLGFIVGWWRPDWAALLILAGSTVFHAVEGELVLGGALWLPEVSGVLYVLSWLLGRRARASVPLQAVNNGKGTSMNQSTNGTGSATRANSVARAVRLIVASTLVAIAVGAVATGLWMRWAPVYSAQALLQLDAAKVPRPAASDGGMDPGLDRLKATHARLLTSDEVLRAAVEDPGLRSTGWFTWDPDSAVRRLRAAVKASPMAGTDLITVAAVGRNAADLPVVVNSVARAYVRHNQSKFSGGYTEDTARLTSERARYEAELSNIRTTVRRQRPQDVPDLESGTNTASQTVLTLSQTVTELESQRAHAGAALSVTMQMQKDGSLAKSAEVLQAVDNDSAIRALRATEATYRTSYDELVSKFGPEHPQAKDALARLDQIAQEIQAKSQALAEARVQAKVDQEQAAYQAVTMELAQAKERYQSANNKLYDLQDIRARLRQLAEQEAQLVSSIQAIDNRLMDLRLLTIDEGDVRIAVPASTPVEPAMPRWNVTLPASLVLGLVFGLVLAGLLELGGASSGGGAARVWWSAGAGLFAAGVAAAVVWLTILSPQLGRAAWSGEHPSASPAVRQSEPIRVGEQAGPAFASEPASRPGGEPVDPAQRRVQLEEGKHRRLQILEGSGRATTHEVNQQELVVLEAKAEALEKAQGRDSVNARQARLELARRRVEVEQEYLEVVRGFLNVGRASADDLANQELAVIKAQQQLEEALTQVGELPASQPATGR